MSFVGTRPEVVKYVKKYKPEYFATLLFSSIEELIDGKLVCGAGGGGFLQVILKKGVTRQQVEERLNEVFMGESIEILEETLWNTIKVFSGYFFETADGERFCYSVKVIIGKTIL